ncbi:MAG: pyridoxamine 5'-phosphate oxidase family protein [Acidobacteria bacterium]|nr:pyridoxamine 5'-phosphate oxidase family protein [Acidobacteriota bacterium]
MTVDRNGLEILERPDCLALLRSQGIGRVGFTSGALPVILPVDYALVEDHIVFQTSPGSSLDTAMRAETVVAFEVDNVGHGCGPRWSVVITGRATELVDEEAIDEAVLAIGRRWTGGGRFVEVSTELISGRRR